MIRQFNFPTTIRFGSGASDELADYLLQSDLGHPLIVTDPVVAGLPFFKRLVERLQTRNIAVDIFSSIHKNPVKSDVYAGAEMFDAAACDSLIGIGGGAALDVSRAVALRIHHRDDLFVYDDLIGGSKYVVNEVPPFVTIPTTAGTGSEVGRSAVIADNETHQKRILFSPKLLARIVFADPTLTAELPPAVTAATGMDALTHNMEAFLARMDHPMCEGIALEGMRMIAEALVAAVKRPDEHSRSQMLLASLMGAVAFQKGLGVVHSLAHPLSQLYDMHHGLANAIMIPYGLEFNVDGNEEKFRRMAEALLLEERSGHSVITYLRDLRAKIGIPDKLGEAGVNQVDLDKLTDLAVADFCHPENPKPVRREDFRMLYQHAI